MGINQTEIAKKAGFRPAYISMILSGARKVTIWETAKRLAEATGTEPILWLEGSPEQIREAIGQ